MSIQGYWGGKQRDSELPDVEARLQATLKPISPRSEYVQDLERRLIKSRQEPYADISEADIFQFTMITLVGLMCGIIAIVLGLRALLAFLSGIGALQQVRGLLQRRRTSALSDQAPDL